MSSGCGALFSKRKHYLHFTRLLVELSWVVPQTFKSFNGSIVVVIQDSCPNVIHFAMIASASCCEGNSMELCQSILYINATFIAELTWFFVIIFKYNIYTYKKVIKWKKCEEDTEREKIWDVNGYRETVWNKQGEIHWELDWLYRGFYTHILFLLPYHCWTWKASSSYHSSPLKKYASFIKIFLISLFRMVFKPRELDYTSVDSARFWLVQLLIKALKIFPYHYTFQWQYYCSVVSLLQSLLRMIPLGFSHLIQHCLVEHKLTL